MGHPGHWAFRLSWLDLSVAICSFVFVLRTTFGANFKFDHGSFQPDHINMHCNISLLDSNLASGLWVLWGVLRVIKCLSYVR